MKRSLIVFFSILVLTFSLITAFAGTTTYPLSVVDDSNTLVVINSEPQKIVSTAPANTEILFYLGFGNKVVGVTDYADYPPQVKSITRIGQMAPLNKEKIAVLDPDVIFATGGFQTKGVEGLRKLGFTVIVVDPKNFDGMFKDIVLVSVVMGDPDVGKKKVKELNDRLMKVAKSAYNIPIDKRPKVLVGGEYKDIWAPGAGSFLNEAISLAGGRNITGRLIGPSGWLPINPEFVVMNDPDIIIIPEGKAMGTGKARDKVISFVSHRPGWENIKAVKNKHIYFVDENILYRPGPRLVDAVELLNKYFFKK